MTSLAPLAVRRFMFRRRVGAWAALCLCLLSCAVLALGCALRARSGRRAARRAHSVSPAQVRAAQQAWTEQTRALHAARRQLGPGSIVRGRQLLDEAIGEQLVPLWIGTPWTFSGKARRPFGGPVACGHFMGALLNGAGFDVDREIGALASARIVRTFAGPERTRWWSHRSPAVVTEAVRKEGDGLYLLGLDSHVGMLRVRGRSVDLCHSTGRRPRRVVCEPAASSPSMRSAVHVWGPLLTDEVVRAWIEGDRIPLAK